MGEDLYRKGKKPYIDLDEKENVEEEVAAMDAWNRHLYRNESVITDLFHGQLKSTVSCSVCPRVSVTFDPMMTMLLPIPAKKQSITFYFLPYDLGKEGYTNFKGQIEIRGSETVMDLRNEILKKYGVSKASYTVTKVNNNDFQKFFSTAS